MRTNLPTLTLVLTGLAGLAAAVPATGAEADTPTNAPSSDAPNGRQGRVNLRTALEATADASFEADGAVLQVVRRRALANQQMKVVVKGVSSDDELDLYMENENGAMVQIGEFEARGRNRLVWNVRTKRGDALPFGVADVAELSDRRIEIRAEGESASYVGDCPDAEPTAEGGKNPRARSSLEVQAEVAVAVGDDESDDGNAPIRALIDVRRKRNGTEILSIDVKDAAPELTLTAYLETAFGLVLPIGTMESEKDPSGDDCDYSLDFRWVASAATLGVVSVSDLAGHDIEIRTESGTVLAVGTVPAVKPQEPADDAGSSDEPEEGADSDDEGVGDLLGDL